MTWVATGTATITAAEIAAAEAAAIAAAEAAATIAAETAAAEAAAAAAAEGASAAATEAAASAAAESVTAGATDAITTAASEVAPEAVSEGILEAGVEAAAPAEPMTPAGLEQVAPAGSTPPPPTEPLPPAGSEASMQTASGPATSDVAGYQSDQAMIDMIKNYQGGPQPELSSEVLKVSGNLPQTPTSTPGADSVLNAKPTSFGPSSGYSGTGFNPAPSTPSPLTAPTDGGGGFMQGFNQFVTDHPFYTGAGIYGVASATGMLDQKPQEFGQTKSTFNNPYRFSPNFKGSHPDANVYKPSYAGYAGSGYAGGGITQATPNVDFMGRNTYPMSQQNPSRYATPSQMPTSAQQTMASYEQNTNPLTGEVSMAQGGQVPGYAGGSLLQTLIDRYTQQGIMPTQDEYLGTLGLHSSFNPEYAFDQANAKFVPMDSLPTVESTFPQPEQAQPSGDGGMAAGGIARYYRGDLATSGGRNDVYSATSRFLDMYDPASKYEAPKEKGDAGIFRDTNPSTRDKSAAEAADVRANAINKKAQVNTGTKYYKPSVSMGQINLKPQGAEKDDGSADSVLAGARGGIMQANLGSYAAGGNPRLLRGPGDGMSDNIPATIGGKQPARLADGEFVVPADVVSHLGNGSTEAGAKKLHGMMDKVRMDRTGKKKQAPAVKAGKYIPK